MRKMLGLAVLAALAAATAATAQPAPPGSYRSQCSDIRMDGPMLSATCRGARGGGQSSINVGSCSSDIFVDASGALTCRGPGAGYNPGPLPPGVGDPVPRPPGYRPPPGGGYGRDMITIYARRNFQGRSARIEGTTPNLDRLGLNDHVRSIELGRRSGPWIVCEDANFRGRCVRTDRDLADTGAIGMDRTISSLRPAR